MCEKNKPEVCTKCRESDFRKIDTNGNCLCDTGYFEIAGKCVDTECQVIDPDCASCGIIFGTNEKRCTACASDNRVLSSDKKSCDCKAGFYEVADGNTTKCEPCGAGCERCSSPTVCIDCAISAQNNGDGTCRCPVSYFVQENLGKLFCLACNPSCLECFG